MDHLVTEARNPASTNLDELTTLELVRLMNAEDQLVAPAVAHAADAIARAIDVISDRLREGGRLIYAGAGTSGRLGVLDATECPPTFNSPPGQVVGIIAGGPAALTQAVEGAEDHLEQSVIDLTRLDLGVRDVLVGIATSGRTPYVVGAVQHARRLGAYTIGLSCNPDSELGSACDLPITVVVGPEVLSGSTRLKAGTATKLVLNMLSTGAMIRLGKVFGNLMVDLRATNQKLRARTNRIVRQLTGLATDQAQELLDHCGGELKTALVAQLGGMEPSIARQRLQGSGGRVRDALGRPQPTIELPCRDDLVLGIDGGGSHTVALLARKEGAAWALLGRGEAGPSNLRAVGRSVALLNLDRAISSAFSQANQTRATVGAACLGLAGSDRVSEQDQIRQWAMLIQLTRQLDVTNDAALLLAAGTPGGCGVAVVAGTGSIVLGRSKEGRTRRAGGWGYLMGDEGSAYGIALDGLRQAARALDGRQLPTRLPELFFRRLGVNSSSGLIEHVYGNGLDRATLAGLAPLVMEAAEAGDNVAAQIVERGMGELALAVRVVVSDLFPDNESIPLALAGGLLVHHATCRAQLLSAISRWGLTVDPVQIVREPAEGALRRALSLENSALVG